MYSFFSGTKYLVALTTAGVTITLSLFGIYSTNKKQVALQNVQAVVAASDFCEVSAEQVVDDVYFVHCGGFF